MNILKFFGRKQNRMDITFMIRTIKFKDTLDEILPRETRNVGRKYDSIKKSVWSNEYLNDI